VDETHTLGHLSTRAEVPSRAACRAGAERNASSEGARRVQAVVEGVWRVAANARTKIASRAERADDVVDVDGAARVSAALGVPHR